MQVSLLEKWRAFRARGVPDFRRGYLNLNFFVHAALHLGVNELLGPHLGLHELFVDEILNQHVVD